MGSVFLSFLLKKVIRINNTTDVRFLTVISICYMEFKILIGTRCFKYRDEKIIVLLLMQHRHTDKLTDPVFISGKKIYVKGALKFQV